MSKSEGIGSAMDEPKSERSTKTDEILENVRESVRESGPLNVPTVVYKVFVVQ